VTALDNDTIVAIATAPGRGGVGIVRLSGPQALSIGEEITGRKLNARQAQYSAFRDERHGTLDNGIAISFPGPGSFTGEDVVELQGHGGPVVMDLLVSACIDAGARPARPGEFSERAFLNNRMDLAQAEAIADLINSTTEQAALNATRSLQGAFSARVHELVEAVTKLRIFVEAAIDFPEEEIDFIADGEVAGQLQNIVDKLAAVRQEAQQGALTREGMKLVIAGRPNAGKSSLLNALAGQETAIVTDIAGTTRDVLREHIQIDGMPLHIVDTAGLRDSGDAVEQEGIRRAWSEMSSADRILLVLDGTDVAIDSLNADTLWPERLNHLDKSIPVTLVINKCDLTGKPPEVRESTGDTTVFISAKEGAGVDLLRQHLKASVGYSSSGEGQFSARRRHLDALDRAADFLTAGQDQLINAGAGELLAEDLRQCQQCLGEITGAVSSDDLLGKIFSSFCIGK